MYNDNKEDIIVFNYKLFLQPLINVLKEGGLLLINNKVIKVNEINVKELKELKISWVYPTKDMIKSGNFTYKIWTKPINNK